MTEAAGGNDGANRAFFEGAVVPIPSITESACIEEWVRLGRPGTWWTGSERVAIAREARSACHCQLCAARKAEASPYAIAESHGAMEPLSAAVVDAVHRIASDPGRLSSRWHKEVIASGISDAQLVELTSVIALTVCVDSIAEGTGSALPELPAVTPGAPSQILPDGATVETAWVPTVRPDKATGEAADYYKSLGGMSANIRRALTLVPAEARTFSRLHDAVYVPGDARFMDMTFRNALTRPQMELIAATVSSANECFY